MSSVGILAWKSALKDGVPLEVPDFRSERSRAKYAKDNASPFPSHAGKKGYTRLPASILGELKPTKEGLALARRVWKEIGYKGE